MAVYDALVEQDPYVGHWLRGGFTKNKAKAIEDCKASIKLGNAMSYIELGRRSFYKVLDRAAFCLNAGLKRVPSG